MLISKYGILSIDMQRAQTFDQAVIKDNLVERILMKRKYHTMTTRTMQTLNVMP